MDNRKDEQNAFVTGPVIIATVVVAAVAGIAALVAMMFDKIAVKKEQNKEKLLQKQAQQERQDEIERREAIDRQEKAREEQEVLKQAQEKALKQVEEITLQEAAVRVDKLIIEGRQLFNEGWEAESNFQAKEADVLFQSAHVKFAEACEADPNNIQSTKGLEICSLKMKGNRLFNEGVKLQQRGNKSGESQDCYKTARDMFEAAKRAFEEGFNKSQDEEFQESISAATKSMAAAAEMLNLVSHVRPEKKETEMRTELDQRGDLINVIEKK